MLSEDCERFFDVVVTEAAEALIRQEGHHDAEYGVTEAAKLSPLPLGQLHVRPPVIQDDLVGGCGSGSSGCRAAS
jgi:hypothetical protein